MPYLRTSRARNPYVCSGCGASIARGERYFRDEPHPMARRHRGARVQHLCALCVLGEFDGTEYLSTGRLQYVEDGQMEFAFDAPPEGVLCVPARVHLVNFTPQIVQRLAADPDLLRQFSPDWFESLVFDLLDQMGFEVRPVGSSTYQRDGGLDAVAWPRDQPFPFLLAVQVKHTRLADRKIGPEPLRDLLGTLEVHGLNAGLLVTNTSFTPDARWFAQQRSILLHLRDSRDLQRWLRNEFLREYEWRDIPRALEVCPGISINLPR